MCLHGFEILEMGVVVNWVDKWEGGWVLSADMSERVCGHIEGHICAVWLEMLLGSEN